MSKLRQYPGIYLLLIFFLLGIAGFFVFNKGEFELMINHYHNAGCDFFFRYFTYLGDGLVFIFLIILLLFYRYYYIILTAIVILLQTIVVQVLKMVIFSDMDRPVLYFSHTPGVHYVEGVTMHLYQTFPSGHTKEEARKIILDQVSNFNKSEIGTIYTNKL